MLKFLLIADRFGFDVDAAARLCDRILLLAYSEVFVY